MIDKMNAKNHDNPQIESRTTPYGFLWSYLTISPFRLRHIATMNNDNTIFPNIIIFYIIFL